MCACLEAFAKRKLPVIGVLLPSAPRKTDLPLFLQALPWIDLREGLTKEGLDRIEERLTGTKPSCGSVGRSLGAAGQRVSAEIANGDRVLVTPFTRHLLEFQA